MFDQRLPPKVRHTHFEWLATRETTGSDGTAAGLSYGHELLSILTSVWEAAGYPCSVRLKALLPAWMPWIRKCFQLSPEKERQLLLISPQQMDRRLAGKKKKKGRRIYGRTKPGYLLKHHIPIKTDSWDVASPDFTKSIWFRIREIRAKESLVIR